jgi:long-chain acyl-CoA synthetase
LIVDQAAQAAGAVTFGIYPTASASEVEYQMSNAGAMLFVAENQEYVDKILPLADKLPSLRWIVVVDTAAMFAYEDDRIKPYEELLAAGSRPGDDGVAALEEMAGHLSAQDPAFIVYTSGTTGNPKGALIRHGAHLAAAYTLVEHYPMLSSDEQRTVVFLPLCHVLGRDAAITLPLISALVPHFGESLAEMPTTLYEVAPTVLFAVPRYLQKFASQVLVAIGNSSPLKRKCYEVAIRIGRRHARRRWEKTDGADWLYRLTGALAFKPVLNKLGMDELRLVISGGAALPPDTMALWQIWGVNVVEIYGQTETAGAIISGQPGPFPRPGNVGTVPPSFEVMLGAENEILVRSKDLFDGYWQNDEATRSVIDSDGWLHTGDVGEWNGDCLRLIDRLRDFIVTDGGKTISPSYVENVMRASPYLAEIAVFGHARRYLTALIEIDYDTVSDWARTKGIAYTGFTSLAHHPDVQALLAKEIEQGNQQLARVEQIKQFRILPKALDPEEDGEPVTPTRKVKRKQMYERFKDLVEDMYDDREERLLAESIGNVVS